MAKTPPLEMESIKAELAQFQEIYTTVAEFVIEYSFQLFGAVIVLILGVLVAGKVGRMVTRLCERKGMEVTLTRFIASIARIVVIAMVLVVVLDKVGISIGPFLAAVGALSLGAGLAVQGLLTNYSAGLSIIITRPFVVGDTITIIGVTGVVKEVKLACTILVDEDEVDITIPNKHVIGEVIHNSHAEKLIELAVGVAYSVDVKLAIEKIESCLSQLEGISTLRKPIVGIENFGDSSINIGIRCFVPTEKAIELSYRANLAVFQTLRQANIEIPFPQREVLIKEQA